MEPAAWAADCGVLSSEFNSVRPSLVLILPLSIRRRISVRSVELAMVIFSCELYRLHQDYRSKRIPMRSQSGMGMPVLQHLMHAQRAAPADVALKSSEGEQAGHDHDDHEDDHQNHFDSDRQ